MLSQSQRTAILQLHAQGVSKREMARVLNVSRLTVRKVLRSNSAQVPTVSRPEKAEPYRQQILELWTLGEASPTDPVGNLWGLPFLGPLGPGSS